MNIPSWQKKIPNCCQSCISWNQDKYSEFVGICSNAISLDSGEKVDARYRCPRFERKQDDRSITI